MTSRVATVLLIASTVVFSTVLALAVSLAAAGQLPSSIANHRNWILFAVALLTVILVILTIWQYQLQSRSGDDSALRALLKTHLRFYKSQVWTQRPIPLQGVCTDGSIKDVHAALLAWLKANESRLLIVSGDFGCGKTWTLRWLAYELSRRRLKGDASVPVPITIALGRLLIQNPVSRGDMLKAADPLVEENCLRNVANGTLVLLDGLDEMASMVGQSEEQIANIIRVINDIEPTSTRFVVGCRTDVLESASLRRYLARLGTPKDRLDSTSWAATAALEKSSIPFDTVRILDIDYESADYYLSNSAVGTIWRDLRREGAYRELAKAPWTIFLLEVALPRLSREAGIPQLNELYNAAVETWLLRYGLEEESLNDAYINLEEFAESQLLQSNFKFNEDYQKAGIVVKQSDGALAFRHYSLLEYFLARTLRREFASYRSDLLSRIDLLHAYGINRYLVPMLCALKTIEGQSSIDRTIKEIRCSMVSVADFRRFIEETGWRKAGFGLWLEMDAPDGTASMSFSHDSEHASMEFRVSNLSSNDSASDPVTGINWYDAFQFCRWAQGRLPTYDELTNMLMAESHARREWSSSWSQERHSWIAVAALVPAPSGSSEYSVELEGLNPDLRLSNLSFRLVKEVPDSTY